METVKRPPLPDPAEVWDRLVESSLAQGSMPAVARSSAPTRLRLAREPTQRHLARLPRRVAGIEPALREVVRALVSAAAPWPLFLHGAAGTGKTCAALCLLDHAGGEYFTAGSLCELMIQAAQGRLTPRGESGSVRWPEAVWSQIRSAQLIVLDELGSRDRVSDHHYETVKRVLDERAGVPLVAISNLDLDALARLYDDRIASRLAAGTIVQLRGRDRRVEG